jgi:hypothetical protein
MIKNDGIFGLYRGFGVAFTGVILFRAFYVGGYDILKTVLKLDKKADDKESNARNLMKRFATAQVHIRNTYLKLSSVLSSLVS